MYERFKSGFVRDVDLDGASNTSAIGVSEYTKLGDLFRQFGGASFNGGLYRVMTLRILNLANEFVAGAFPGFAGKATCFGYDWLGRVFALDSSRPEGDEPGVVMFEPGTGKALEIPSDLITFHESEIVDYRDEALAAGFHDLWLARGGSVPRQDQCVGYERPLFLGGKDLVENLKISDLDVYWTLTAQLIQRIGG